MILHLPPDAPFALKAGAAALLVLHIGGASLGLASGSLAILARKGGRLHRLAGAVFFAAMIAMGAAAAVTAPFFPDRISALMGAFVVYLALTGRRALRGRPGRLEAGGALAAAALSIGYVWLGWIGRNLPGAMIDQEPSQIGFVMGAIAALAAAFDLRVLARGGLAGPARLARHLWRMSLALAIAWGSFAGQPKAQPPALRGSPLLILPALAVLALLIYGLIRVRMRPRPAAGSARRAAAAA